MATVTAVKNGNWSDTTVWDTGVVPVDGDTVKAASYAITFDVDINQPNTTLEATSGSFAHTGSTLRTITANANKGNHTTQGLIRQSSTGSLTFNGEIKGGNAADAWGGRSVYGASTSSTFTVTTATGGSAATAYGIYGDGAAIVVTTATGGSHASAWGAYAKQTSLTVTTAQGATGVGAGVTEYTSATIGTAIGGSAANAYGFHAGNGNAFGSSITVTTAIGGTGENAYGVYFNRSNTTNSTITTSTGGSGVNAHGVYHNNTGTLTVTTATGGSGGVGAYNNGGGVLTVITAVGNSFGVGGTHATHYAGVHGAGTTGQTTRVRKTQSGPYGAASASGAVLMQSDTTNTAEFRTAYNGATRSLTVDVPAVGNVRAGTVYYNGTLTGTLAVPATNQVAVGVAVDNTVGTAVLTASTAAAAIWNATRSSYTTAGTFGQGVASVQGNVTGSAGSVTGAVGSVTGNVGGNVTGSVGSVAGNVTGSVGSVASGGITSGSFAAGAINAAAIAADAIGASELAADAVTEIGTGIRAELATELGRIDAAVSSRLATANYTTPPTVGAIADAVWDEAAGGHTTVGTTGQALGNIETQLSGNAAVVAATLNGSTINIYRGDTLKILLTNLTDISTRTALYWTVKSDTGYPDADATLQVSEAGGLLRLNGAATTAANGSIVVTNATDGDLTITVKAAATATLTPGTYYYDVQAVKPTGVQTLGTGLVMISADVTNAVS